MTLTIPTHSAEYQFPFSIASDIGKHSYEQREAISPAGVVIWAAGLFANYYSTPDKELRSFIGQQQLSIEDIGWTKDRAAQVRAQLSVFAEDWDDPSMDAYDAL